MITKLRGFRSRAARDAWGSCAQAADLTGNRLLPSVSSCPMDHTGRRLVAGPGPAYMTSHVAAG